MHLSKKKKELPTSEKMGRKGILQEKNETLFIICRLNVFKKLGYNGFKPSNFIAI